MSEHADFNLSEEQIKSFHENGFLIIENFVSDDEIEMLRNRTKELIEEEFAPEKNHTIFSTYGQDKKHGLNQYFADSVDKISFFLEKSAQVNPETGELLGDKFTSINKIGHAMHDLDEIYRKFSHQHRLQCILKTLSGFEKPLTIQSMYIFKAPFIGGEVISHQDATFVYNEQTPGVPEKPVVGCWFALEEATKENGCLWVLPGSNKWGLIKRWVRVFNEEHQCWDMEMRTEQAELLPHTTEMDYEHEKYIPVEVKKGTLVVLHGYLLHKSFENTSSKSREAFTLHSVDGAKPLSKECWIQPKRQVVNYFD